jgi:hypothetical protein
MAMPSGWASLGELTKRRKQYARVSFLNPAEQLIAGPSF